MRILGLKLRQDLQILMDALLVYCNIFGMLHDTCYCLPTQLFDI